APACTASRCPEEQITSMASHTEQEQDQQHEVATIAVLGAGTMGRGIAHVAALAGYTTHLFDTDRAAPEKARASIHRNLDKGREIKKVAAEAAARARPGLHLVRDLTARR